MRDGTILYRSSAKTLNNVKYIRDGVELGVNEVIWNNETKSLLHSTGVFYWDKQPIRSHVKISGFKGEETTVFYYQFLANKGQHILQVYVTSTDGPDAIAINTFLDYYNVMAETKRLEPSTTAKI